MWWNILAVLNKVVNIKALVHHGPVAIGSIRELPLTILHQFFNVIGILAITTSVASSGVLHLGSIIRIIDVWPLDIIEIRILNHANGDVSALGGCGLGH